MIAKHTVPFTEKLKADIPASIVVFLVAVPLCLGIALASGAPLFSGLISGMVGGIVVTSISKSSLGVSGPAAGLAVIVLSAIQELESFEVFLFAVVLAGVFQIILAYAKAGIIGYYFPSSVIKGMLSGIGIIIFLKQIPHAFGYDADPEGDFKFFQVDGHNTLSDLVYSLNYLSQGAVIISVLSLAVLIFWETDFMKRFSVFKIIQGPLVVVVLGIVINSIFAGNEKLLLKGDQLVNIPVAGTVSEFFGQFSFPDFSAWKDTRVYVLAVTIAIVASLETLLCVEATDKLDPEKNITPTNRELLAQGVGNIVSGFIGGLPVTQVIVRSSANIQSGGKSRISAFLHGVLIFISVMAIPSLLNKIPLASLAAILLMVGYKLAKPSLFKEMYGKGKSQFIPYIVTILGIVFTDLLIGIGMGMVVGVMHILWNNYKTPYHFNPEDYVEGQPVKIDLSEDVSFLNKASILQTLNHMPDDSHVIIDASKAKNVHPDVYEIIEDFRENGKLRDIRVETIGFNDDAHIHPLGKFKDTVPRGK